MFILFRYLRWYLGLSARWTGRVSSRGRGSVTGQATSSQATGKGESPAGMGPQQHHPLRPGRSRRQAPPPAGESRTALSLSRRVCAGDDKDTSRSSSPQPLPRPWLPQLRRDLNTRPGEDSPGTPWRYQAALLWRGVDARRRVPVEAAVARGDAAILYLGSAAAAETRQIARAQQQVAARFKLLGPVCPRQPADAPVTPSALGPSSPCLPARSASS
jgi:hypothetical protein